MNLSRILWLASAAAALLLMAVVATFSPIRIQITFDNQTNAANAGTRNLPTTTPLPPTAIPATPEPPTAVPATPMPPTAIPATPEPPERRERKTATPIPSITMPEPTPPLPLMQQPQISIVKRASVAEAMPGDRLSYTLVVTNNGQGSARDVVVSDDVPVMLKVVDLRSTKGDIVVQGQRVTAYPRTLDPGETQIYTIVVQIEATAKPGSIANTAIITTTTIGDDTGDNTSTTTITITRPLTKQAIPPRLPTTADPNTPDTALLLYWPLLVLALGLVVFGVAIQQGAFRQQILRVQMATTLPTTSSSIHTRTPDVGHMANLRINPDDLYARWNAGASLHSLVELVAQQNPQINHLMISLTIQQLLSSFVTKQ